MAKYKQVETKPDVCEFKEVTKSEVEDSVIAAMEEGQAKIAELAAEITALKEAEATQRAALDVVEAENVELKAKVVELTPNVPKVHEKKMAFINDLRERDTKGLNKTCASCSRRLPIAKMANGAANFCDDCLGK